MKPGRWPPRDWLQFSYEHNRAHGHVNAALAGITAAAWAVFDWLPLAFPTLVFTVAAIDHLLEARQARKKLLRLYP